MFKSLFLSILPKAFFVRWGLDENEKHFIKLMKSRLKSMQSPQGPKVLLQMPADYFCLTLFSMVVSGLRPSVVGGLWHQNIMSNLKGESLGFVRHPGRRLARFLDRQKWAKIYATLGVRSVLDLEPSLLSRFFNKVGAKRIMATLKGKQDLLDLRLNGLVCGDLIYDTYLRYRVQPTVDVNDPYLAYLIAKALDAQQAARSIFKAHQFDLFFSNYSSYIQHGIPVRVALECGVDVYTAGNLSQYLKKLSVNDHLHTTEHWTYKEKFSKYKEHDLLIAQAKNMLEKRFTGGVDEATQYMKTSAFLKSSELMPNGVEGVVFLHDFFDSPHCHRWMLFPDFLDWARFTLGIIEKHQLPIAIKPHPNQLPESIEVVDMLKKEFPSVRWLPTTLSNQVIFQSGIRCGISVYGTILHELAYHGIPALAAGDHPHSAFDIATTPNSIEEYRRYLIQFRELRLSDNAKKEVLAFYYMHNINKNEGLDLDLDRWGLRSIGPNESKRFGAFINSHPNFPAMDKSS